MDAEEGLNAKLEDQLRFETLLTDISARFVALPAERVDATIEDAQRRIVETLDLDRSTLFEFSGPRMEMTVTHSYARPGLAPLPRLTASEHYPWVLQKILRGESFQFSSVDELPPEAARDAESIRQLGPKSNVTFPLSGAGRVFGALAFGAMRAERQWPERLVSRLRLLAQIVGGVLAIRRAEEQAAQMREQLSHASRVTTLGGLATTLAHELNQPLAAIHSNAEAAEIFLQKDPPDLRELRAILADIRQDGYRAGEVIHRMRSLLEKHRFKRERIEVRGLVEALGSLLHGVVVSREARLRIEVAPALPPVQGDAVHLQQLLLNLILNALDAMSDCPAWEREVVVRAVRHDTLGVEVSVSDQGPGFPKEKLAKLFEPFFTTKREGMGIGLTICNSIIQAHGGHLSAENHPKRGAIVRFTLPASQAVE